MSSGSPPHSASLSSAVALSNWMKAAMNTHVPAGATGHEQEVLWSEIIPWNQHLGLSLVKNREGTLRLELSSKDHGHWSNHRTVCTFVDGSVEFEETAAGTAIMNLIRNGTVSAREALCLSCYPKGYTPPSPEVLRDDYWQKILDRAVASSVMSS